MTELMAEHIQMPGCPDLIVTRAQAWSFLISIGHPSQGGFGSVDYMVMNPRRNSLDLPLSDDTLREQAFAVMRRVEGAA